MQSDAWKAASIASSAVFQRHFICVHVPSHWSKGCSLRFWQTELEEVTWLELGDLVEHETLQSLCKELLAASSTNNFSPIEDMHRSFGEQWCNEFTQCYLTLEADLDLFQTALGRVGLVPADLGEAGDQCVLPDRAFCPFIASAADYKSKRAFRLISPSFMEDEKLMLGDKELMIGPTRFA